MTLEIKKPELEAFIQEKMQSGVFHDVDELLTQAFHALDQKQPAPTPEKSSKRLIDILMSPAFAGSELKIERLKDYPEPPVRL